MGAPADVSDLPMFQLTLRPLPDDRPVALRLRAMLKNALRQQRLRCVEILELPAPGSPATAAGPPRTADEPPAGPGGS